MDPAAAEKLQEFLREKGLLRALPDLLSNEVDLTSLHYFTDEDLCVVPLNGGGEVWPRQTLTVRSVACVCMFGTGRRSD